jgi:23S rRNA (cytosine1962-C5)-methyltransferase
VTLSIRRASLHPWIYRKMCRPTTIPPGSIVEVVDREGKFAGRGFYNRRSQIAIRLLTEDPAQAVDDAYLDSLLDAALSFRRRKLRLDSITNAYRVVHAEGDGMSGLVIDRLGRFVVAQIYSIGWYRRLRWLGRAVASRFPGCTLVLKADPGAEEKEGFRLRDFESEKLADEALRTEVEEAGIRYGVDLRHGHKTGFFCDQREHRLRVRELAGGRRVLDGCTYTGGFALNAAAGGAAEIEGVDLDEKAVAIARENAERNHFPITFHHADLFDYLRAAETGGRRFELVILDPPKFAAGREGISAALHRYRDLNRLGASVLTSGGVLVTCSCSGSVSGLRFREAVLAGFEAARVRAEIVDESGASADHPVRKEFPEGGYLKVLTLRAR